MADEKHIVQFVTTVVVDGAESGEQAVNIAVKNVKAFAELAKWSDKRLKLDPTFTGDTGASIVALEVSKSINSRNFYDEAMEPRHFLKAEYSEAEHKIVCDTCRWEAHEEMNAESDHNYGERHASCCVFCHTQVFDSSDTIDQVRDEHGNVPETYGSI
tara:strand:- start:7 stop:480 length:474 start_codon:yes stop_codon:yes gene_type:complete